MTRVEDIATVRSKNVGPFWITIDIFCDGSEAYRQVRDGLDTAKVAAALHQPVERITRFDIESLNVVKLSLARPQVQGSREDRDMHGAQMAIVVSGIPLI